MDIQKLTKEEFPPLLKEMPDAPKKLYYRGMLPTPELKLLAVVGSRRFTQYEKEVCEKLIGELSGAPISIVSGLALGIDALAHKKALEVGLHVTAIPGSGLNDAVLYPRTNVPLAKMILHSKGVLISESEPDEKAALYSFPRRNRIIAGISHAALIIGAKEKSGSLITARLAMEYNRDVLIVPGSIHSASSKGPHHLLKNGAGLVESGDDILEALGIQKEKKTTQNTPLSKEESALLNILQTPLGKDELVAQSNMPISEIDITLSALELKGIIEHRMGKIYLNT